MGGDAASELEYYLSKAAVMPEPSWLDDLAAAMNRSAPSSGIDAGYTYIGQLISHDIVPNTDPRRDSRLVTKALNLDSIYGTTPGQGALFDTNGRFLLGGQRHAPDLVRSFQGIALIPEKRNDENTIISQLHLFWQSLHNRLLQSRLAVDFDEAHAAVVSLFQLVVVEDFLVQILETEVYKQYFRQGNPILKLEGTVIPSEFSHAAFRFGHSMVRSDYALNADVGSREDSATNNVSLSGLLRPGMALTSTLQIDWRLFFDDPSLTKVPAQRANKIDALIVREMSNFPNSGNNGGIALRNLRAGIAINLPSGVQYLNSIKQKVLHASGGSIQLIELNDLRQTNLSDVNGLTIDVLPLWPYILLEAKRSAGGEKLGLLGSLICADVLCTSIRQSDISILDRYPHSLGSTLDTLGDIGKKVTDVISLRSLHSTGLMKRCITMHDIVTLHKLLA